ncbi:MAG: hypothetical protein JWR21_315 [Herminiimonas sp.]|nr:hypothetical protein [Herminiimonas sp.]MDB5851997.1 hypothetical protein [Herminiimonas sp.]
MSPQENQLLQDFLNQLVQVRGVARDPEADAMIRQAVSSQPDASYLLVQRALIQEQALNNAKAQIAALQQQIATLQRTGGNSAGGSFLNDANAWGNNSRSAPLNAYGNPLSGSSSQAAPAAQPTAQQAGYAQPAGVPQAVAARPSPFGGGSFLGTMAATAAGVAGGAFLFQGIGNLMGHHNNPGLDGSHGMADISQQNGGLGRDNSLASSAGVNDIGPEDGRVESADDNNLLSDSGGSDDFLSDAGGSDDFLSDAGGGDDSSVI